MAYSLTTQNTFKRLKEVEHKTLILTASHDKLVPKSLILELHKEIPNSIFKVIDKAGHESIKEKAPEVNKIIFEFLEN